MRKRNASLTTDQKALAVNLDKFKYGTIVEIGAGQEVARRFIQVGAAAGTITKTMSAYDMAVSDDVYGQVDRYVSQNRLLQMLDKEFNQVVARLTHLRAKKHHVLRLCRHGDCTQFQADERMPWLGRHPPAASPGGRTE